MCVLLSLDVDEKVKEKEDEEVRSDKTNKIVNPGARVCE